ncbi:diacylglycerol kinase [Flaviaesturariibacter flavus]|uniref:Diacylglycerol kinase n=1 Tax=Flaviaesturariibacter flavus TaxID=2502780 RepID=A0A4R1B4S6_9BACT|nr:diacylglycerol kinase family protein [Flaviaesturariibacter flavus]TCJ13114.1 diacylglycerol kinase [Flaviaesturariibacter flavus]
MRHLLLIINPISGTRGKADLPAMVEARCKSAGFRFSQYPSVANGDYSYLDDIIVAEGVTDLLIAGGDGTINAAVNGLRKHGLPFGILPCGSGNGLAFSAGISPKHPLALETIIAGHAQPVDAFTINGHFACMLCGLGFDAQVAHDFANDPRRGLNTYIRKTVSNFFAAKAYPFLLSAGDRELDTQAFFISIANSNQFGNNVTIAPKASLSDGLLDIVVATRQSKLGLLLHTARQIAGYNEIQNEVINEKAGMVYFQTPALDIYNPAHAPLHIDGDPAETAENFEVRVIQGAFRLLMP